MISLENSVREILIQKSADETYKLMETPKYQDIMKDVAKTMVTSMSGDEDEHLSSEIDEEMCELFSSPERLKQAAYEGAKNQYITKDQMESQFEKLYMALEEEDFNDKVIEEFKKSNKKIYKFVEHQDKIVSGLVEIARRDGIEKIMGDEAEYEVIRNIFPTADEYIKYGLKSIQIAKEYLANVQNAMSMDEEMGELMGSMYSSVQKSIEKIQDLNEKVQKEKFYEKAKKIYDK